VRNEHNCCEVDRDTLLVESCGKELLVAITMGNSGQRGTVYLSKKQIKQLRRDLKQHLLENQ
jgi:hypothetical protein